MRRILSRLVSCGVGGVASIFFNAASRRATVSLWEYESRSLGRGTSDMIPDFLKRFWLDISHGPYSRHYADFDRHRGRVVASWAGLESSLDQANHLGWRWTKRAVSKAVPISFNRKVALFRKLHREVPQFVAVSEDGTALIERILTHLEDRHFLVHGYNAPDEDDRAGWKVRRHIFGADGFDTVERRYTLEQLKALNRELTDIIDQAVRYTDALLMEFGQDPPKDRSG